MTWRDIDEQALYVTGTDRFKMLTYLFNMP
jgi:hypothetical protein